MGRKRLDERRSDSCRLKETQTLLQSHDKLGCAVRCQDAGRVGMERQDGGNASGFRCKFHNPAEDLQMPDMHPVEIADRDN